MADPVLQTAAGQNRRWKFAGKTAWGYPFNYLRNAIEHTFAYTHIPKKVSAGSAGAVHAAIATVVAGSTTTSGFTQPDVPRVLAVTTGGTTADFAASTLTIVGTNVEGKVITDVLAISDNQAGQTVGSLVFKTVTSVTLSKADNTGGTYTIDTTNKLGLVHRVPASFTTAIIVQDNTNDRVTSGTTNMPATQAAPSSSNFDNEFTEKNWVTPATTPDGTTFLYIFYWFHKVKIQPLKDSPDFYSTTTSTSTSSTSTSSSTSSTSTSLSTSSTSFSSTSSSTSSTSTSTTTLPL